VILTTDYSHNIDTAIEPVSLSSGRIHNREWGSRSHSWCREDLRDLFRAEFATMLPLQQVKEAKISGVFSLVHVQGINSNSSGFRDHCANVGLTSFGMS
jgi:hypothetical protein